MNETQQEDTSTWQRMTKEEINEYPIRKYEGSVHVIRTEEELACALSLLKNEKILGFDTETRPAYVKGVSYPPTVLQLATATEAFVFQLNHLGFPQPLIDILANPDIVKTGVAINFDISELVKLAHFKAEGFLDLADWAKEIGIQNHGLRGLAAVLLGFRISKNAQTSNWAKDVLTPAQVIYAATDAWVGRELYLKMQEISAVKE